MPIGQFSEEEKVVIRDVAVSLGLSLWASFSGASPETVSDHWSDLANNFVALLESQE